MNKSEFETKLNEVYKGAVKPLNRYLNKHAVLCFKCTDCGLVFFGKLFHMVGKYHQQHLCNMPYGDKNGERLQSVGHRPKTKKKDSLKIEQLNKLIWEDYSYQQIAKEFQINPNIVKGYFKDEGLI
ncbi:MAG: adenylate kinase [Bacillota bacterium]|nr:adenylate kinase [Bacillota bacterium]